LLLINNKWSTYHIDELNDEFANIHRFLLFIIKLE